MAQLYEGAENITGPHARLLLEQAGLSKTQSPLVILDNACGTGVVSSYLYDSDLLDVGTKDNLQLTCGDFSESMVQAVKERIERSHWKGAKAQIVDAQV
jgi:ubiquinone/menaquinone biosynthesis C-methylase UbiE